MDSLEEVVIMRQGRVSYFYYDAFFILGRKAASARLELNGFNYHRQIERTEKIKEGRNSKD